MKLTPPLKITVAGARNSSRISSIAQGLIDADGTNTLRIFRDFADNGCATTNIDCAKVLDFDDSGAIISGREIDIHRAGGDRKAGLHNFKTRQGDWYIRREKFESLWEDGDRIIYFALNCGGPGTEAYGPICLRITKGSLDTNPSAVFPSDSLQRYTNDLNEIDTDRIMGEIGCSSSKGNVALIEYQTHSSILDQERWSGIVCSDERYLEITVIGPLSLDNIVELRIRSEYAEEIDKLIDKEIAGEKIEPYERTQVLAISALRAWTNVEITVL